MNNLACAISKKQFSIGEKVKIFVLTKSNDINFDSINADSGYKAPFLYIDAIFQGEDNFSFPQEKNNKRKIDCILDVIHDRASFNLDREKEFYPKFRGNEYSDEYINQIFHDILVKRVRLEYDYFKKVNALSSNKTLIKYIDLMNENEVYLSLMVVKENIFNLILQSRLLDEISDKVEWNLEEKLNNIMNDKFFPFLEKTKLEDLYEKVEDGEIPEKELYLALQKIECRMLDSIPNFIKDDHNIYESSNFRSESYKFSLIENAHWAMSDFIQHNRFLSKMKELDLFLLPSYFPGIELDMEEEEKSSKEWLEEKKSIMAEINKI